MTVSAYRLVWLRPHRTVNFKNEDSTGPLRGIFCALMMQFVTSHIFTDGALSTSHVG